MGGFAAMTRHAFFAAVLLAGLGLVTARAAEPQQVSVKVDEQAKTIDFLAGKDLITRYHYGPSVVKPYFWPIISPAGKSVSRAWPMEKGQPNETTDHKHQ
jgi:hypothetical protein